MSLLDMVLAETDCHDDNSDKLWLRCYQQQPLLRQQPLLLLLLQYYAEKQHWSFAQRREVCQLDSAEAILKAVELPVTERIHWLCGASTKVESNVELVHYAQSELKALYQCLYQGYFDPIDKQYLPDELSVLVNLARLLSKHPVLPWAAHEDIVQLTEYPMLFLEAHQQHHCGLTYRHELESQDYAMFKVLQPERATLGLKRHPKKQRFVLDQLMAANNQDVSNQTRRSVKRWLKMVEHNR